MTKPTIHLLNSPVRALCGTIPTYWTRDPLAVNCPRCTARMEAQPA